MPSAPSKVGMVSLKTEVCGCCDGIQGDWCTDMV